MTDAVKAAAGSAQSEVVVNGDDLPLHCPGDRSPLWSMHPRVFLDVTKTGSVRCPYCGTIYKLAPGAVAHSHGH